MRDSQKDAAGNVLSVKYFVLIINQVTAVRYSTSSRD